MFTVYLREEDNTWTPCRHEDTKTAAVAWADAKRVDYQVEQSFLGGRTQLVAIRSFATHLRRAKQAC